MKIKSCFILIICLLLLAYQIQTQRGGGSRSRSSRSSSRSYSRGSSKKSKSGGIKLGSWQWFAAVGLLFTSPCLLNCCFSPKQSSRRPTRRITDAYEKKNQQNTCTIDEDQRNKSIDWFMSSKWTVQYKTGNGESGSYSFRITDIVKKTDFVYEIQALGENQKYGNSNIKGILLFQRDYLSICFDKVYDDREKAGQTGIWKVLVYEGVQQGEQFSGRWYYEGLQNMDNFSGEMKMIHQ